MTQLKLKYTLNLLCGMLFVIEAEGQKEFEKFARVYWYTGYHYNADSLLHFDDTDLQEIITEDSVASHNWLDLYNIAYLNSDTSAMSYILYEGLKHASNEEEQLKAYNLHAERLQYLGDFQQSYLLITEALEFFQGLDDTEVYSMLVFNLLKLNLKLSEVEVGIVDSLWNDVDERIQRNIGRPIINNQSYIACRTGSLDSNFYLGLIDSRKFYAEFYNAHFRLEGQLDHTQTLENEMHYLSRLDNKDYLISYKIYQYFLERHWLELTKKTALLKHLVNSASEFAKKTNDWEVNNHLYSTLLSLKRLTASDTALFNIFIPVSVNRSDPLIKLQERGKLQQLLLKQEKKFSEKLRILNRNLETKTLALLSSLLFGLFLLVLLFVFYIKLSRSKRIVDQKVEHISTINAILAHDMKAPLISLLDRLDEEKNEHHDTQDLVRSNIMAIKMMMDDLLLWSFHMKNESFDQKTPVYLLEILDDCLCYSNTIAQARKVTVRLDFSFIEELIIYSNKFAVEVVIRNLLFNALMHSEEGGQVRVDIIKTPGVTELIVENNYTEFKRKISTGIGLKLIDGLNTGNELFWLSNTKEKGCHRSLIRFMS